MNNRSTNQVTAIRTTIVFCSTTSGIAATSSITSFAGALLTAANKLILIDNFDLVAEGSTSGVTIDTSAIRTVVETVSYKCRSAIIAFASSQTPVNNTLIASVNYTKSDMKSATKKEIVTIATAIHKAAAATPGALNFGISATDITDLQAAITLYNTDSTDPRQATINKNNAIKQIKVQVKEINQNIFKNIMDNMVRTLETANPTFVQKYFLAREIIDLGITHTKMTGTTKDQAGVIVKGALIELTQIADPTITYKFLSDDFGKFSKTLIKPGEYNIEVAAATYISITETKVKFEAGKNVKRNYMLLPI